MNSATTSITPPQPVSQEQPNPQLGVPLNATLLDAPSSAAHAHQLALHDRLLPVRRPLLVGIVNLTPDSFSDGGRYPSTEAAVTAAQRMILDGADILDLGAESSRPGADPVSAAEELARLVPVLPGILQLGAPVSIDTYKPEVADACLEAGVHLINDITGLGDEMLEVAAKHRAPAIVMHMAGVPKTMQLDLEDAPILNQVYSFLRERIEAASAKGVQTIADIGFGFGKTVGQNLELIREFQRFGDLGVPLLVGTSRKSSLGAVTGSAVDDRLVASLTSAASALERGAQLLRVHDVAAHRELVQIHSAVVGSIHHDAPNTTIRLSQIPVDLHLGVPIAERQSEQRATIDVELRMHYSGTRDQIDDALDYTDVPKRVQSISSAEPVKLLETLAAKVAEELFTETEALEIELKIHKPQAAAAIGCGDVILEQSYQRPCTRRSTAAYVALGSNLADRSAYLDAAVQELRRLGMVEEQSSWIETEPEGGVDQPDYLNGVVCLRTLLTADELLEELLLIERRFGRERTADTEPSSRTLDLDLLLFGSETIDTPSLSVPHPRLHQRTFVLEPLRQIAPDVMHPVLGTTATEMLAALHEADE